MFQIRCREVSHIFITDKPNVSEVRVTEISVDIQSKEELDSQSKQREAESAANDFFSMGMFFLVCSGSWYGWQLALLAFGCWFIATLLHG